MKQPKFKFGDKIIKGSIQVLIDGILQEADGGIYYRCDADSGTDTFSNTDDWIFESDGFELYQEPQKKKLYAHHNKTTGEVKFRVFEYEWPEFKRAPEFDMDYSLGYACTEIKP